MKRILTRCLYGTLIAGGIVFFGSTAANAAEQPPDDESTACGCVTDIVTEVTDTATDAVDDIVSSATEHDSQPPAEGTAPPAEDSAPPAEDAAPPAEDTAPPVDDTAPPAEDTAPPAEDTTPPAEETAPPASEDAEADSTTSGDDSVAGGTNVSPVVNIPITISGTAVSIVGDSTGDNAASPTDPRANAGADGDAGTSGDDSVAGGSAVSPVVNISITANGISVSGLGDATASGADSESGADTGAADPMGAASDAATSGDDGIASGTAVNPVVNVPVDLGGLAIAGLGDASTTRAAAGLPDGNAGSAAVGGASDVVTSGDDSGVGGSVVDPTVALPISVRGLAVSVIGDAATSGADTESDAWGAVGTPTRASSEANSSGDNSVAGGTAVSPVVDIPVDLAGIAVSGLGDATTSGGGDVSDVAPGDADADSAGVASNAVTSGDDSVAGGTAIIPVVEAPVTVNGSAVSVVGDSTSSGAESTSRTEGSDSDQVAEAASQSSGDDSVLGGTVVDGLVDVPVTVNGNAISGIGDSITSGASAETEGSDVDDSPMTSGDDSVLGGSLIDLGTSVPVTIDGNAISVIGDSTTEGPTTGENPGTDDPGTDDPGTDVPGTEDPGTDDPGTDEPGTEESGSDGSGTHENGGDGHGDSATDSSASSWNDSSDSEELPATGPEGSAAVLGIAALLLLIGAGVKLAGRKRALRRH